MGYDEACAKPNYHPVQKENKRKLTCQSRKPKEKTAKKSK